MNEVKKEIRFIVNDLLLDSDEFNKFLEFLHKKDLEFTYAQSHSSDLVEHKIICRPLLYDWFCTYYYM